MTREELFAVIGDVDEQKVRNAGLAITQGKKTNWAKWGAVAACLCLVVLGFISYNNRPFDYENSQMQILFIENGRAYSNFSASSHEMTPEQEVAWNLNNMLGYLLENDYGEVPYFYGGCYLDNDYHVVVSLTEDTEENRNMILAAVHDIEVDGINITIASPDVILFADSETKYSDVYLYGIWKELDDNYPEIKKGRDHIHNAIVVYMEHEDAATLRKLENLGYGDAIRVEIGERKTSISAG